MNAQKGIFLRSCKMSKKPASESKIPTTGKNSNRKKQISSESDMDSGNSLLKRNEFAMILGAALVITILAFFWFFKGPSGKKDPDSQAFSEDKAAQVDAPGFESRISALEVSLAKLMSSSGQDASLISSKAVMDLDDRVTRLETAVNLKLDTLIERMGKLEARLNRQKAVAQISAAKVTPAVKPKAEAKPAAPVPEKVAVKTVKPKKVTTPKKKPSQFHTVQKGETLYSISRKYKISVGALRKLNNLTLDDKIYPGNNLLVR